MTLIAEVKTSNPFGWRSDFPEDYLLDLALEHGDWIAIHTDREWGGSIESLGEVRRRMTRHGIDKPLLAKGLGRTDVGLRLALAVADFALVVGRWPRTLEPELQARLIFEPVIHDQIPLAIGAFSAIGARPRLLINARDLRTGQRAVHVARAEKIKERHPDEDPWVCRASFITTDADTDADADAHLVGTRLPEFLEARGQGVAEIVG